MKFVTLDSNSINDNDNIELYGAEAEEGMVYVGDLSSDGESYTLYPKAVFASLGEELSSNQSVFVGEIVESTWKEVTAKLTVFCLRVYCKGAGDYNSYLVNCKSTSNRADVLQKYALGKGQVISLSGSFTFQKNENNGKVFAARPELFVSQFSFAGTNNKSSDSSSNNEAKKSKAKAAPSNSVEHAPIAF